MFGLNRDTWVRIGLWLFFALVVISGVRSCSAGSAAGNVGNGVWILFFVGLIVATVISRDHAHLPWIFSAMALLILVILLGKVFQLFSWDTLGLLLVATAFIAGYMKTTGRTQSFLGFAAGVVVITWFYMFAQSTLKVDLGFLGDRVTGNKLIIGLLTIGLLTFAAWKRSVLFYALSFLVLAAWLGDTIFNQISTDFPKVLTPTVSKDTKDTWEEIWGTLLKKAREAVKPGPTTPSTLPPASSPPPSAASATLPKKELKKFRFPIDFFAGERVADRGSTVEIRDGGYAIFRVSDLPWRSDAAYYLVFSVVRKTTGKHHFEVNGGRGGTFFLDHFASERVETCVFNFNSPGQSQFFHPGDNRFKISSPGDCIVIQNAYVHMEYWS